MAYARQGREVESLNGWWHTWLDEEADWRGEPLLPLGTAPAGLPARPPSAGWHGMEWGMESTRVPGTWEQARAGYHGVAWQWRPIVIPEEWAGRAVHLAVGGARQRIEVYLDERPIGYDLDGLTPFTVDLTPHVRPGRQHELALRVTNAGGWDPGRAEGAIRWGKAALPGSPDVGGLWGGLALLALPRLRVEELVAWWDSATSAAAARAALRNDGPATTARVLLTVTDPAGRIVSGPVERNADVPAGADVALRFVLPLSTPPEPWASNGDEARLYRVSAVVTGAEGGDRREAPLGLRHVESRDGRLYLDGKPLAPLPEFLETPVAGEFVAPTPAEALRAIARAEGAPGLAATIWPAGPALLDVADRAGLPVVQTLVGLEDPAGVAPDAVGLYRLLAEQRLRRIIRAARGHPAIVAWRLPLPPGAAFDAYARLARDEDPTRPVLPVER